MARDGKQASSDSDSEGVSTALALYGLLPSLVQRRMPKPRSLKQMLALAQYSSTPPPHSRAPSYSSVDISPPPSYRASRLVEDHPGFFNSLPEASSSSRPSTSGSVTPSPPYEEESGSGVKWKYAEPGFTLNNMASQEEAGIAQNPHFARRQYVAGVACMLRGLPSDLSAEEILSLRETLPPVLASAVQPSDNVLIRCDAKAEQRLNPTPARREPQTLLQFCVSRVTLYIFLALSFMLPYVQLFLKQAYQYDRKHKISDRVLAQSMITADAMGRGTLTIATNICAMNDGKVGESMKEVGTYVMQGFSGGLYDGLGEGMQLLGLRARISMKESEGRQIKAGMTF